MNALRNTYLSITLSGLIIVGLMSGLIKPVSSYFTTKAFSSWFASTINKADVNDIEADLDALTEANADLHQFISLASELVRQNKRIFRTILPFSTENSDIDAVANQLITQWNSTEAHNSMADVPPRAVHQFLKSLHLSDLNIQSFTGVVAKHAVSPIWSSVVTFESYIIVRWTLPFLNGVAIGAP